jgi:hypothetical protein
MRRLLPLLLVCATAAPALADGAYFSESFGGTHVKDELGAKLPGAFRFRVAGGYRFGQWAIEGWFAGDLGMDGAVHDGQPGALPPCSGPGCDGPVRTQSYDYTSLLTYGLDVKYLKRVSPNLEIYLRGSVSHGVLDSEDYGGRGLGIGAGIQLKGKVPAAGLLFWPLFFTNWGPKMTAAVFLDDGFDFYRLHPGGDLRATPAIDAQLTHLTLGFAVGSDF